MKRLSVFLAAAMFIACINVAAVPATKKAIKKVQPDGSVIWVRLHGDEHHNWMTCGDSYVQKMDDGFYRKVSSLPGRRDYVSVQSSSVDMGLNSVKPSGEKRFLVMLIEFSDLKFTTPHSGQTFSRMLSEPGYSDNGATGSVKDYFRDQSRSAFNPVFDVVGPVNVGKAMTSYSKFEYGMGDYGAPRLLAEACALVDGDVDFSIYDTDSDGVIDNVFFFFAGYNYAEGADNAIWPHAGNVKYKTFSFDGVQLYRYACTSEYKGYEGETMAGIGNFCHEFSHVLGLPDLYDTDHAISEGLGEYSLMHSGCFNNGGNTPPNLNCEELKLLGWLSHIPVLAAKDADCTLGPIQNGEVLSSPTGNENEYYCYEYRNGKGWDAPVRSGLVIYHVDKSLNAAGDRTASYRWKYLYGINNVPSHQCFDLIEANLQEGIIPFGNGRNEFSSGTNPSNLSWAGNPTGYDLSAIRHDGNNASFHLKFSGSIEDDEYYKMGICAIDLPVGTLRSGDVLPLELLPAPNPPTEISWYFDGVQTKETSVLLTSGVHSLKVVFRREDGTSGSYETEVNVL